MAYERYNTGVSQSGAGNSKWWLYELQADDIAFIGSYKIIIQIKLATNFTLKKWAVEILTISDSSETTVVHITHHT